MQMHIKESKDKVEIKDWKHIKSLINEAEYILIGAGSGLSASAGLDYFDTEFFSQNYSIFHKKKYKCVWDGLLDNWHLTENNATSYWAFWAVHIHNVFYKHKQLGIYKMLYGLVKNKDYFVVTTNVDNQFFEGNFNKDQVFAMQGSYGFLQCQKGCHSEVYDSEKLIETMHKSLDVQSLKIMEKHIPRCQHCGALLVPNLRKDHNFIEEKHMVNKDQYMYFVDKLKGNKVVLLELGVGFSTPGVIRYPFEKLTESLNKATLIRVNKDIGQIRDTISHKAMGIKLDIGEFLEAIRQVE